MKTETIIYCIVALLLGMLLENMLKNMCGCKTVEGQNGSGIVAKLQNPAWVGITLPTPSSAIDNSNGPLTPRQQWMASLPSCSGSLVTERLNTLNVGGSADINASGCGYVIHTDGSTPQVVSNPHWCNNTFIQDESLYKQCSSQNGSCNPSHYCSKS